MPKRVKVSRTQRIKKELRRDPNLHRDKLVALKPRNKYKNDEAYLKAVYRANKDYIDTNIKDEFVELYGTPQKAFNALVKEQMASTNYSEGRNYNLKEAIKKVNNSSEMNKQWSKSEIKANNFKELLKRDKEIWNELRKKEFREKGRFAKYDPSKLKYRGQYNDGYSNVAVYQYGDTIIIERKSPTAGVGASIYMMSVDEFEMAVGKSFFEV